VVFVDADSVSYQGWAAFENGSFYPKAVTRVLYEEGFLNTPIIDDPVKRPGYMIYTCNKSQEYAITATLDNPTAEELAYAKTTCSALGSNGTVDFYGKNYAVGNKKTVESLEQNAGVSAIEQMASALESMRRILEDLKRTIGGM
jgi:hypothetical protein